MPTQYGIDVYILVPSVEGLSSAGVLTDKSGRRLFTFNISPQLQVTQAAARTLDDAVYALASVRHNDVAGN